MSRYFFHVIDGGYTRDNVGIELHGLRAARVEAFRLAGLLLADMPELIEVHRDFRMEVTDYANKLLFTIVMMGVDAPVSWDVRPSDLTPS